MSLSFNKSGIITISPSDILNAPSTITGAGTWSGTTFTCNKQSATMSHSQVYLNPYDIYVLEYSLRCSVYTGGSGVFVGQQVAYWGKGDGTNSDPVCMKAGYNFTTETWNAWSKSNNPYSISNYVSKDWGTVKTYVCGSKVQTSMLPPPERTGGASTYAINCLRVLGDKEYTYQQYTNRTCFWRLGSNTLNADTVFQFKNIKAYPIAITEGDSMKFINGYGIQTNDLIEF